MKVFAILALPLVTMACGQTASAPNATESKSTKASGTAASAAPAAVAAFPDYAPQYPGSAIVEQEAKTFPDFSSIQIQMTTNDSVEQVSKFYRASLAQSASMPITYDESTPEKLDIMAGDFVGGVEGKTTTNLGTSLSAKVEDGKTNIYIMLNKPKN